VENAVGGSDGGCAATGLISGRGWKSCDREYESTDSRLTTDNKYRAHGGGDEQQMSNEVE